MTNPDDLLILDWDDDNLDDGSEYDDLMDQGYDDGYAGRTPSNPEDSAYAAGYLDGAEEAAAEGSTPDWAARNLATVKEAQGWDRPTPVVARVVSDWDREIAMQAGMGLGIQAYNDALGQG